MTGQEDGHVQGIATTVKGVDSGIILPTKIQEVTAGPTGSLRTFQAFLEADRAETQAVVDLLIRRSPGEVQNRDEEAETKR